MRIPFFLLLSGVLSAQGVEVGAGFSSVYVDRYNPYTASVGFNQALFSARVIGRAPWSADDRWVAALSASFAPSHSYEGVSYGYSGVGVMGGIQGKSKRWDLSTGVDLRLEKYTRDEALSISIPSGQTQIIAPRIDGQALRAWGQISFTYQGILVPFEMSTAVIPFTKFELSTPFIGQNKSGAEKDLVDNLKGPQLTVQFGVRFKN